MIGQTRIDRYDFSEVKKENLLTGINFWRQMMVGSFLFMIAGWVSILFLFSQLLSVGSVSTDGDVFSFIILLILSSISYATLRKFIKGQKEYIRAGEESLSQEIPQPLDSLKGMIISISVGALSFGFFWNYSGFAGEMLVPNIVAQVSDGPQTWLDVILSGFVQLIYVGSVAAVVSSAMYLNYHLRRLTHSIRIDLYRLRFQIISYLISGQPAEEYYEDMDYRCRYCWRGTYTPNEIVGGGLVCKYCGHEYLEPNQREGERHTEEKSDNEEVSFAEGVSEEFAKDT